MREELNSNISELLSIFNNFHYCGILLILVMVISGGVEALGVVLLEHPERLKKDKRLITNKTVNNMFLCKCSLPPAPIVYALFFVNILTSLKYRCYFLKPDE